MLHVKQKLGKKRGLKMAKETNSPGGRLRRKHPVE
jgi:hypothetical protein